MLLTDALVILKYHGYGFCTLDDIALDTQENSVLLLLISKRAEMRSAVLQKLCVI